MTEQADVSAAASPAHAPLEAVSTTDASPEAARKDTSEHGSDLLKILERFGLPILFVVVVIVFSLLRPNTFATAANWRAIASTQSVLAVAALALIVPLMGGRFDVSVGANLGLCGVVAAAAMSKHGFALLPAVGLGVGTGCLVGLVNGYIVAYLGVNSIIGTLGVATIIGGIVSGYTKGIPISQGLSPTLTNLGINNVLGVPEIFIAMVVIAAATWFGLTQTAYSRRLTAVGSNLRAARLTGMPVNRIVLMSFVGAGFLAGLAGVLQVASLGNADPSIEGITFILTPLAAAFLGATTLQPGTYNVPGTLVAIFFLGMTLSGLALVGAQPWATDVFNGLAVVVAVALAAFFRRRRTGSIEIGG